jgi:adenine-specific DNA-methyltransferase
MIKYLGSKRRLVPTIVAMAEACGAASALDLFTGTTRVAQALKAAGLFVTAVDSASYSEVLAEAYVATDADEIDATALEAELARLDALEGRDGYVTEVFCRTARYFQPDNGRRIDAIREEIETAHPKPDPLRSLLLTSLLEAADRVDSTTGVQMAFLKSWAPRASRRLELRPPGLLPGGGCAIRGDAVELCASLAPVDFAYLDPPYNQHRYFTNYHVWETLVRWDAPEYYGVACKRSDARSDETASPFNRRGTMQAALAQVVTATRARLMVLSYNDESWVSLEDLVAMCRARGAVEVLRFDSKRYVGAQIGIHNPDGEKVGSVGRLRNEEWMILSGDPELVASAAAAGASTASALQPQ